tara:strand:+ start:271 stop:687 length:417 start_codon:yes stop_codon:yes gene_type:complete
MLEQIKQLECWKIILIIISLIIIGHALYQYNDDKSANNMLESFDDVLPDKQLTLFYAPWCGHCKTTMPIWKKTKTNNKTGINMNEINCDENEDLAKLHNIQGYPTIKYLPNGIDSNEGSVEYDGERNMQSILSFLKEQ